MKSYEGETHHSDLAAYGVDSAGMVTSGQRGPADLLGSLGRMPPAGGSSVRDVQSPIRTFPTGATRNSEDGKFDYEGFFDPEVVVEFARYMHSHRKLEDGALRASDNWQKGIPTDAYRRSLMRHVIDVWMYYRGHSMPSGETNPLRALSGVLFNTMGLMRAELNSS